MLKAYRELEMEGLVAGRQGQGTFVLKSLAGPALAGHAELRAELVEWLHRAWTAGMDDESITALVATTLRDQITTRAKREEGAA